MRYLYIIVIFFIMFLNSTLAQWQPCNNNLNGCRINAISVLGNKIFVASEEKGVFRSDDEGQKWLERNDGLYEITTTSVITGGGIVCILSGEDFYSSVNYGETWKSHHILPTDVNPHSICYYDSNFYVLCDGLIFKLPPDFSSHKEYNLTSGSGLTTISSLIIDGNYSLYGTFDYGIWVSTNQGKSWEARNNGLTAHKMINTLFKYNDYIFAGSEIGVYRTSDYGINWVEKNNGLVNLFINQFIAKDSILFVATNMSGIYRSTDSGESWTSSNDGLVDPFVNSLEISGDKIFAGTRSGVFVSTDNGNSWSPSNTGLPILAGYLMESNKKDIFLGTQCGVFQSRDNGDTWVNKSNGLNSLGIYYKTRTLSSLSLYDSTLYASIADGALLFRSTDYCESWSSMKDPEFGNQEFGGIHDVLANGKYIFVTRYYDGIMRSGDNGKTWEKKNDGLTFTWYMKLLAIKNDTLFAVTNGGALYRTTNSGETWDYTGSGVLSLNTTSLNISNLGVFAGTSDNGIFFSTDNGSSWQHLIGPSNSIQAITVAGTDILTCGYNGNVYFSPDTGKSWYKKNIGLPEEAFIFKLAYNDSYVFAGTDSGMYRARLSDILDVKEDAENSEFSIYPNPAQNIVNINYNGILNEEIKIFDILGNKVWEGNSQSSINVDFLPVGLYFIKFGKATKSFLKN